MSYSHKVLTEQQDRQYMHYATMGHVRLSTVTVEKQQVLYILSVCVCSLSYPT